MGIVKEQINKIKSPVLRAVLKPLYLMLLKVFFTYQKCTEVNTIKRTQNRLKALEKSFTLSDKKKVRVLFLVINASIWKYDRLFQKMLEDDIFEPIIFICPQKKFTLSEQQEEIDRIHQQFHLKGYPIVKPFDADEELIDIKQFFEPHIVFFTNPHELSHKIYSITNFKDTLTAYAPYSIMATKEPDLQYDKLFHNLLWKMYNETPLHQEMSEKFSRVKGKNAKVAGSAILEALKASKSTSPVWQNKVNQKKIIYAPHHTFNDLEQMNFSTILKNGMFMLELAKRYKDKIHIAFKPHPVLKSKLYRYHEWGRQKTDDFYNEWEKLENTQIEQGDYIDLFQQSDAMILDSISFMTEYLFVNKPTLFLFKDKASMQLFNDYGISVLNCLDWAFEHSTIEKFVLDVIEGNDSMINKRTDFLAKNYNFNQKDFSDFVISDIKKSLNIQDD